MGERRIILVGYRGCGKSSVAAALAARWGLPALDLDAEIERRAGRPIPELFASDGEAAFRALEAEVLAAVLAGDPAAVIATGGGVVETPDNRRRLRDDPGCVVYLAAPAEVLSARLAADDGGRPSLTGGGVAKEVSEVLARREARYREVAEVVVAADRPLDAVVAAVVAAVENRRRKSDESDESADCPPGPRGP